MERIDITPSSLQTSPGFVCFLTCRMSPTLLFSPPVQAGCGALRVEQAPERQVHGSHGAPLLEHGAQHQSVGPQAVRDDQVSQNPVAFTSVAGLVLLFFLNVAPAFL